MAVSTAEVPFSGPRKLGGNGSYKKVLGRKWQLQESLVENGSYWKVRKWHLPEGLGENGSFNSK